MQSIQPLTAGEFIVSEAPLFQSREAVVLAAGAAALQPGQVLGRVTATGKYVAHNESATDGSQIAAGVLYAFAPANRGADTKVLAIVRDAEVDGSRLNSGGGASLAAIQALAQQSVVTRVFAGGGGSYIGADYVQAGYVF